jgi:Na+/H+ antiporter NhaC
MTTQPVTDPNWTSVLPPVLAIVLAVATRQVYLSLAAGILLGCTILSEWNPLLGLAGSVGRVVDALVDRGNAEVVLFTFVVGALIATVEASGGVRGFVARLDERRWVDTPRRAGLLVWILGVLIFIESNITILVGGAVGRPLFDRFRLSRERLAYIIEALSPPVCMLIPLNAWGALVIGLIGAHEEAGEPVRVLAASLPLQFYSIATVIIALVVALFPWDIGPMRAAERRTRAGQLLWPHSQPLVDPDVIAPPVETSIAPRAINMILPVLTMVVMMPVSLLITARMRHGQWDMLKGAGSTSVLWATLLALAVAWVMLLAQRAFTVQKLVDIGLKGAGGLISMAIILLLAMALAGVAKQLGAGPYIARATAGKLAPVVMLPLIFLVACVIGFCTGTSWGTFALMLPLAIPVALGAGWPVAPFVAAALSGGVFGDHASPISDSTIVSSMAAATDLVDHVRTQLPYALIAVAVATVAYALTGAAM